ncbi:MAG: acyl carrier protein [Eisenbergiella massiliensis]|uniref:acyl carrier protein n=1 Tax=Eisenbergiella massiliensis TaxID=1720294 RepID=UPI0039962445
MERKSIAEQILNVFKMVMKDDNFSTDFDEDITGGLDSIGFVTLVVELENEFDIEFDDEDFELSKMKSVNQITDLVIKYLN